MVDRHPSLETGLSITSRIDSVGENYFKEDEDVLKAAHMLKG